MSWAIWSRLRHTRFARVLFGYLALAWATFMILSKLFEVARLPIVASQRARRGWSRRPTSSTTR